MASLQTIFKQFDLDGSGYIDVKELKQVAKKLGQSLSDKQIKQLMIGIDTNKDAKISYEEFKQWWIKGHKGRLNDLIILKSKSIKKYNQLQQKFQQYGFSLNDYKPSAQLDKILMMVSFQPNGQERTSHTGFKLGCILGKQATKQIINDISTDNPYLDLSTFTFSIVLPTDQPKKLQKNLNQIIKYALDVIGLTTGVTIHQQDIESNDYINIRVIPLQKKKAVIIYIEPGTMVRQLLDQIYKLSDQFLGKMGEQFVAEFQLQLSIDPHIQQILNSEKTLLQILMEGFYFDIEGKVSSQALKLFKKFLYKLQNNPSYIAVLMFRKLQVELKIRSPQKLQQFFKKLGILDIVKEVPSLSDLIDIIAPQLQSMKRKLDAGQSQETNPFFQVVYKLFKALTTYVNPGTKLSILKQNVVVYGFIQGGGLKQVFDKIFPK